MVGIVIYGAEVDKDAKSCHLSPTLEQPSIGVAVVGPIWRGRIEIIESFNKKLDGLEVFMPKTSYSKVVKVTQSMESLLCFSVKDRHALWPKHFDELGAALEDIDLFIFPDISRSERDYDDLVEHMISNDLAMTSRIGNLRLVIFTSLEQQQNQQQIQGKYYLWGIFKGKTVQRCKSLKGTKTSTEKTRIGRFVGALDSPKKPNISPHTPPARCDLLPSLSQVCKRTRSKRRRVSPSKYKELDGYKVFMADFAGNERIDQPSSGLGDASKVAQNCIINEIKEAEQHSWDSDMDMDENASTIAKTSIINKTKEAEQHSWDSDMEID